MQYLLPYLTKDISLHRHMPKNPSPKPASILDTVNMLEAMATDSSDSDSEVEPPLSIRLYSTKPRNLVQRRATITGASPTAKHNIDIEQFWKELKQEHNTSFQLRDKAASCAHGLDNVPSSNIRPQTCLGLESTKRRKKTDGQMDDKKVQFQERSTSTDTESTQADDARRIVQNAKERITLTTSLQMSDDGASVASKDANKDHSPAADSVSDSNNSSDTTVPLDECNNFISDTHSISKSGPVSKEAGVRHVKERGKLDKSHSTPAYDLSDNEAKEESRKLAPLESLFCKLDLSVHCPNSVTSSNLTKTDDHRKSKDAKKEHKEAPKRCSGNVARKISDIEKQIAHENADEQACVFGVPKELDSRKASVRSTANEASCRNSIDERYQSNIECNLSDVNTCEKRHAARESSTERESIEHPEVARPRDTASEHREEPDCANAEGLNGESARSSSSNDGDEALQKFGKILQTVDCALTQHARLLEKKSSMTLESREDPIDMPAPSSIANSVEDDVPHVVYNVSKVQNTAKPQAKEMKPTDSSLAQATVQSCRYIELPKIESVRKFENKLHMTPPEPPPRKYYTKQTASDLKFNSAPKLPEELEKPQVPERPSVRRDLRKVDLNLPADHVRSSSDCHDRRESSDICAFNYAENSMDFIDESRTVTLNEQKFAQSDASLYSENNDKQCREEKYSFEKYEPFVEKFACSSQSIADCYKTADHSARSVECPDGATYSKQTTSPDPRSKLPEKDKSFEKSVVNRAMMVARSIGLHGSLSKSNSSPRSSRKRNMLLASEYDEVTISFSKCNYNYLIMRK